MCFLTSNLMNNPVNYLRNIWKLWRSHQSICTIHWKISHDHMKNIWINDVLWTQNGSQTCKHIIYFRPTWYNIKLDPLLHSSLLSSLLSDSLNLTLSIILLLFNEDSEIKRKIELGERCREIAKERIQTCITYIILFLWNIKKFLRYH